MKNKIKELYIKALNEDLPPNVFADEVLRLFAVSGMLPLDNDKAWNTLSVIEKLTTAADILLHDKDYDGGNWEEIEICYQRGKEILQQFKR